MAVGKGGKSDPAKKEKLSLFTRYVLKTSQAKTILKNISRMRVSSAAAQSLMYALTYLIVEITDGAQNCCVSDQKKKILPKHINQCIATDNELKNLGSSWVIKSGGATGFLRNTDPILKKKKKGD